jgi:hypothetical protein
MRVQSRIEGQELQDCADLAKARKASPNSTRASALPGARGGATARSWISDVHLGTRGCNGRLLIDFLDHVDSETLYLVATLSSWVESARQFLSSLSPVERRAAA